MGANAWEAWGSWVAILVSLGVAVVGWARARRANEGASEANRIAADALNLARSAEERADRLERLALESRDVQWTEREMEGRFGVSFQHTGSDTAHEVRMLVEPVAGGWDRREEIFRDVEPTGRIGMDLTDIARQTAEGWEPDGSGGLLRKPNALPGGWVPTVRVRITWRSAEGAPEVAKFPAVQVRKSE
jgi:hypothetical protein